MRAHEYVGTTGVLFTCRVCARRRYVDAPDAVPVMCSGCAAAERRMRACLDAHSTSVFTTEPGAR